jgi:hypothetical protein
MQFVHWGFSVSSPWAIRGILVKADDGVIQNCVIRGCGMSAISIGPEYYWNEANYSWNVTVADNLFSQNALRNNLNADGVIFVHGDGAMGNRNITIIRNRFEDNYSPNMMNIAWADGVKITDNIINTPAPLPLSEPGHIMQPAWRSQCHAQRKYLQPTRPLCDSGSWPW